MDYKELETLIQAGEIGAGSRLFITDYRHDNIHNKPLRHIKPTEVILYNNVDLPPRKHVYYADYHFRAVSKTGKILSAIIAPYDNTGYRSFTGGSLNIFLTLKEAQACYVIQCQKVIEQAEEAKAQAAVRFDEIIQSSNERIRENS